MENLPTPYSRTTVPELESITLLEFLLDKNFIKPHIAKYDKIPNHDGKIEITDETQHFIGEFSVQVKTLNKDWGPVFYFGKEFLNYCRYSLLPVLILLCDKNKQQVYWRYISAGDILDLEKKPGKSVIIRFNETEVIAKDKSDYVSQWNAILTEERDRKFKWEVEKDEALKLKQQLAKLKKLKDKSYQKEAHTFTVIHAFLDHYNGFLDREFKTLKEIFYPGIWKMGIAIEQYEFSLLRFIKYPVPMNTNDTLIKIVKTDNKDRIHELAESYISYYKDNPIESGNGLQLARDLIGDDLHKALKGRYLKITHPVIAREILTRFIDDFHPALGLEPGLAVYGIDEVELGLNTHIGLLYEELHIIQQKNLYNPAKLEHIWNIGTDDLLPVLARVQTRLQKRETIAYNYQVYSDNYDISYIIDLLRSLKSNGLSTIERLYQVRHVRGDRPVWARDLSDEQARADIETFFTHLPAVYDQTLQEFFSELYKPLHYFQDHQHEVVLWGRNLKPGFEQKGRIELNLVKLKSLGAGPEAGMEFIHADTHHDPSLNKQFFVQFNGDPINLHGRFYQRQMVTTRSLNFLDEDLPLSQTVYAMLKEKISEYLSYRNR